MGIDMLRNVNIYWTSEISSYIMVFIKSREKHCEVTMQNFNIDFLKNLFKVGMTKAQFINAYSEMCKNPDTTNELDGVSIFDADKTESIASDLFDMININKAKEGKEDSLDADEIKQFSNLDKTDGEDNMTDSDLKVLLNNYEQKVASENKIDTPEKMYKTAMSKEASNGDSANTYLQSLEHQISSIESLATRRQENSIQIMMNYHNEINQLVQNDNNVSADLKAKYAKENEKLKKLNSEQSDIQAKIQNTQSELDSANADYENIQDNIEAAQNNPDDETDYTSDYNNAQKTVDKLGKSLNSLQRKYSGNLRQISTVSQNLKSYQRDISAQSSSIKAKIEQINKKIEMEQASCTKDIEKYSQNLSDLRLAQTYAINQVQTESAATAESYGNGDDTYVFDESNYSKEAVNAVEKRWASKAKKNGLDHKFFAKVVAISKDLKCDPNELLGVMNSECGLNASARNSNGGATGLIQFMPRTAKALGTSTDKLAKMSAYDQLDYVAKFYKMNKKAYKMGDGPMSAGDLYSLVFLPGRANRNVLTSSNELYYKANAGLDMDGDGKITKADLNRRVHKFMA